MISVCPQSIICTCMWIRTQLYVGVKWLVFLGLHLLSVRFMPSNLCCIRKYMIKHQQNNQIANLTSLDVVMVIGSAC